MPAYSVLTRPQRRVEVKAYLSVKSEKTLLVHTPGRIRLTPDGVSNEEGPQKVCKSDRLALECKFLILDELSRLTATQLSRRSTLTRWRCVQHAAEDALTTVYSKWEETLRADVSESIVRVTKSTEFDSRVEDVEQILRVRCRDRGKPEELARLGTLCKLPHAYDPVVIRSQHFAHYSMQLTRTTSRNSGPPYEFKLASLKSLPQRKEGIDFPGVSIIRDPSRTMLLQLNTSSVKLSRPHALTGPMLKVVRDSFERDLEGQDLGFLYRMKRLEGAAGDRQSNELKSKWASACLQCTSGSPCTELDIQATVRVQGSRAPIAPMMIRNDWLSCPSDKEELQKLIEKRARKARSAASSSPGDPRWGDADITREVGNQVYGYLDRCKDSDDPICAAVNSTRGCAKEIMRVALKTSEDCVETIRGTIEASWRLSHPLLEESLTEEASDTAFPEVRWPSATVTIGHLDLPLPERGNVNQRRARPMGLEVVVQLSGRVEQKGDSESGSAVIPISEDWKTQFSDRVFFDDVIG